MKSDQLDDAVLNYIKHNPELMIKIRNRLIYPDNGYSDLIKESRRAMGTD